MIKKLAGLSVALGLMLSVAPAYAFPGVYVAPDVGYGNVRIKVKSGGVSASVHNGGLTAAGILGYRFDAGFWVFGAEGRFGQTDSSITDSGVTVSAGREYAVSGLIGYNASTKWFLFATVGYDNLRAKYTDGITTLHDTTDGVAATLGVEYAVAKHVSLRGSVTRVDYDSYQYPGYTIGTSQERASVSTVFHF